MTANKNLEKILTGSKNWNRWRKKNGLESPGLEGADLQGFDLSRFNLSRANLAGACLKDADLSGANLSDANLCGANLDGAILKRCNLEGARLKEVHMTGADLTDANLRDTDLFRASVEQSTFRNVDARGADFERADFSGETRRLKERDCMELLSVFLRESISSGVDFSHADLSGAKFFDARMEGANLFGVTAVEAEFSRANLTYSTIEDSNFSSAQLISCELSNSSFKNVCLSEAKLSHANLHNADVFKCILDDAVMVGAKLVNASLTGSNLKRVDLSRSVLVNSEFNRSNLCGCKVYGVSAWDLKFKKSTQANLIITDGDTSITVDNLEVAQFVYSLLNNEAIRGVLDTVTSKTVLILGRFTTRRKAVLNGLRHRLRDLGFVPVVFDFEPTENRDLTETIQLLAGLAKFVIADLTDPKSVPQELSHIIPNLPSVPVKPIILSSQREYAMWEHWSGYPSVAPIFRYKNAEHLLDRLQSDVINSALSLSSKVSSIEQIKALQTKVNRLETELAAAKR